MRCTSVGESRDPILASRSPYMPSSFPYAFSSSLSASAHRPAETWDDGAKLDYGAPGKVVGTTACADKVVVRFPGSVGAIGCFTTQAAHDRISRLLVCRMGLRVGWCIAHRSREYASGATCFPFSFARS